MHINIYADIYININVYINIRINIYMHIYIRLYSINILEHTVMQHDMTQYNVFP